MPKPRTVHLYPVDGVSLYPWPAVECDVPEDVAADLLAHVPPPFTTTAPEAEKRPETGDTP